MNTSKEIIQMVDAIKRMPISVVGKTNLYFDLGIDSLSFIKLLLSIEEKYKITFDISEMEKCLQVSSLVTLVASKVGERVEIYD